MASKVLVSGLVLNRSVERFVLGVRLKRLASVGRVVRLVLGLVLSDRTRLVASAPYAIHFQ